MFGDWLTVQEAVAYCLSKGLHRTPKTVRKWAMRSRHADSGSAEIVAKPQDTENGFRWLIERASLDVKIAREIEFEARKNVEGGEANASAPVPTGANMSIDVPALEASSEPPQTSANMLAHVHTGAAAESTSYAAFLEKQLERANQQLDVKDKQIDALLERDRETNFLIQGLQSELTRLIHALPDGRHDQPDTRDAA
jgi:hypothetical protein